MHSKLKKHENSPKYTNMSVFHKESHFCLTIVTYVDIIHHL